MCCLTRLPHTLQCVGTDKLKTELPCDLAKHVCILLSLTQLRAVSKFGDPASCLLVEYLFLIAVGFYSVFYTSLVQTFFFSKALYYFPQAYMSCNPMFSLVKHPR